ncbi:MAG: RhuM family protein [Woeseiaceae bacterium]
MSEIEKISNSIVYSSDGDDVEIIFKDENVWATQKSMSGIFETDVSAISKYIDNIFSSKELDVISNLQKMKITNSSKPVEFYSLDVIISVGHRVNSKKATQFRVWANNIIKQYIKDGYIINEELLRSDPKKLNELAAKLRELRANEKNIYASVRECFKLASSDYEPSSKEVRKFYSLLQDKFHHAITRMTASKLILDRANHVDKNMGIQLFKGAIPTKNEVTTGKNYLDEIEIYRMHLLSEQFLLYAESTALSGKKMTMKSLHKQLDNLLRLNGYPVFDGYIDYLKDRAIKHADNEYKAFIEIKKLEHIGLEVDLELFYQGEYDEYKEQTILITSRQLNNAIAIQEKA